MNLPQTEDRTALIDPSYEPRRASSESSRFGGGGRGELSEPQRELLDSMLSRGAVDVAKVLLLDLPKSAEVVDPSNKSRLGTLPEFDKNFENGETIAGGGHALISRALDLKLRRFVAVKSLRRNLSSYNLLRNKFIWEARITAQLDHPAIVPTHGFYGDASGGLHLSMKLVGGVTLGELLRKLSAVYERLPRREIVRSERKLLQQRLDMFLQVCEAVSYAHHHGVIHRDLKPANIMIGLFNQVYVMDWGIAEFRREMGESRRRGGRVFGTLRYMAPEILNKEYYDSRSDVYSLGMILYELVFLASGYDAQTEVNLLRSVLNHSIGGFTHRFRCPVDGDLKAIVRKSLAYGPDFRYQTVRKLVEDLRSWRRGAEVSVRPDTFVRRVARWCKLNYGVFFSFAITLMGGLLALSVFLLLRLIL